MKELRAACDKYDMKFEYIFLPGTGMQNVMETPPRYNDFYSAIDGIAHHYGEVHEVWFDGANGEGPNGKKQVYDWDAFTETIQRLNPKL